MKNCDVVIVNFNTGEFLKAAVESTRRSRSVAHICVVDNASTDASLDFLASGIYDQVTVIRNTVNLGFAAGCNIGLAHLTAENVLLLNPDCWLVDGAIESLIAALRSDDRVGMVGPLLLNPDGSEQAAGRRNFPTPHVLLSQMLGATPLYQYIRSGSRVNKDPLPKDLIEVDAISGACMMVRREAAAAVGPLDESYFLHWEDLDWCMRFCLQGWTILFAPQAKVFHEKGVSSRRRRLAAEYYKHKGLVRFYQKFLSDVYPRWLIVLMAGGVWMRFAAVASWHLAARLPSGSEPYRRAK